MLSQAMSSRTPHVDPSSCRLAFHGKWVDGHPPALLPSDHIARSRTEIFLQPTAKSGVV